MKKVKIMLMSLLLLGVVGGALAFKAKFVNEYCVTSPRVGVGGQLFCTVIVGAPLKCPLFIENSMTTHLNPDLIVCTTTPVAGVNPCPSTLNCHALASLKSDE